MRWAPRLGPAAGPPLLATAVVRLQAALLRWPCRGGPWHAVSGNPVPGGFRYPLIVRSWPWPWECRNATARKLAVPDLATTTVLTLTITGIAVAWKTAPWSPRGRRGSVRTGRPPISPVGGGHVRRRASWGPSMFVVHVAIVLATLCWPLVVLAGIRGGGRRACCGRSDAEWVHDRDAPSSPATTRPGAGCAWPSRISSTWRGSPPRRAAGPRGRPGRAGASGIAACLAGDREAGARIVGRTNLHELALGVTGINPWYGTPVNPLDPTPGPRRLLQRVGGGGGGRRRRCRLRQRHRRLGAGSRAASLRDGRASKTTLGPDPARRGRASGAQPRHGGPDGPRRSRPGARHGAPRARIRGG